MSGAVLPARRRLATWFRTGGGWLWVCSVATAGVGLGLRVWGIGFGLPDLYHPDEPAYHDELAKSHNDLAVLYLETGQRPQRPAAVQ